jgi:hypothetical protein
MINGWATHRIVDNVHMKKTKGVLGIFIFLPNDSSAGSLRAGQRVERTVRVGIRVSHRRKERARRLASRSVTCFVVRRFVHWFQR